jgi:hypothetical protein
MRSKTNRRTRAEGALGSGETSAWRRRRLIGAGFTPEQADLLAHDCAVDLHALIELVERGCAPVLATRILAPLDHERKPC